MSLQFLAQNSMFKGSGPGNTQALSRIFGSLHEEGRDDLIWCIVFGGVVGAASSIPAMIVGNSKSLSLGGIFWLNAVAGAAGAFISGEGLGGLPFAIVTGIASLVYALVKSNSGGKAKPESILSKPAPVPAVVVAIVGCLLALPQVFTTQIRVAVPDNRSWMAKMLGEPAPYRMEEVTNWIMVLLVTAVVAVVVFLIAQANLTATSQPETSGQQAE